MVSNLKPSPPRLAAPDAVMLNVLVNEKKRRRHHRQILQYTPVRGHDAVILSYAMCNPDFDLWFDQWLDAQTAEDRDAQRERKFMELIVSACA